VLVSSGVLVTYFCAEIPDNWSGRTTRILIERKARTAGRSTMSSGVFPWTLPPPLRSKVTTGPLPFCSTVYDLDQQWLNANSTVSALSVNKNMR
jgi:hypothetical protein